MGNTWAVCKREFKSYFFTPIGYVVVGVLALITGLAFSLSFGFYAQMSQAPTEYAMSTVPDFEETFLSPFLVFCGTLIMFLTPLVTMRLLAEERNRGTMELLLTYPLRDREIVFGKYLAALGILLIVMLVLGVQMVILAFLVDQVEIAVLVFGLLAVFLMSAAFMSLGLFVSAMARNQITAATVTFGVCLLMFIMGTLGEKMPEGNPAPEGLPAAVVSIVGFVYGAVRGLVLELPVDAHARNMALGVVEPLDIAYYVLFSAFFLFLTFRALESGKWRG